MECQADHHQSYDLVLYENRSQEVQRNHVFRMQYMKPDAASSRLKNRGRQKMIQVHQHRRQQDKPVFLPVIPVIPIGDCTYEEKMEEVVDKCLEQCLKV